MQIGDKVRFQPENSKHSREATVILIEGNNLFVGVGEKHYFNYKEMWIPRSEATLYIPLSDEDYEKFMADNMPKVYEFAKEVFAKMLPDVQLIYRERSRHGDASIEADGYGVTLDPCVMEVKSIGRIKQIGGYTVTGWHSTGGNYMEPPDIDDVPFGEFSHSGFRCATVCRGNFRRENYPLVGL